MRRLKRTQRKHVTKGVWRKLNTRVLRTEGPDSPVWTMELVESPHPYFKLKGSLVRLKPPHDASESRVVAVRDWLKKAGVAKVKVMPRAPAPAVINRNEAEPEQVSIEQPRLVIERMVAGAFTDNREELSRIVQECLAKAEGGEVKRFSAVEIGHIVGIRLENWMCFKGSQEIELGPMVYSITASGADDPERSNWMGKSSFLRAVVFALSGKYPSTTADGWIHGNEASGAVDVEFSSGVFISRFKKRGKPTQLEVSNDGGETLTGEAAQRFIEERIIDYETLRKTAYFAQKQTDQFITMGPTERSATVSAWLGIVWIADAGEYCRSLLNKLSARQAKLTEQMKTALGDFESFAEIESKASKMGEAIEALCKRRDALNGQEQRRGELAKQIVAWNQRKSVADQRGALESEIEAEPEEPPSCESQQSLRNKLALEVNGLERELKAASRLVASSFDGRCPVANIECPAVESINSRTEEGRVRCSNAELKLKDARKVLSKVDAEIRVVEQERRQYDRVCAKNEERRRNLGKVVVAEKFLAANPSPPDMGDSAREELNEVIKQLTAAVVARELLVAKASEIKAAEGELKRVEPQIQVHRQAMMILGRSGAQREIATAALYQIEKTGNEAIQQSGVGLKFQISWEHETKKLADACDNCGAPFPASARVKKCERCGEARGKKLAQELRINLSNRSGGADDLAGVMFQLAAANWLRSYHEASWSVFLIDEPFGALDRAHVRRLSVHLGSLLGEQFGACQSFIVAHHADVLESTPGRILIRNDNGVSKLEVNSG